MEDNKLVEHKTLAILSIVFGGIGLGFSWIPIINNLAFFFAVAGAILGVIAVIRNRKLKKVKSIVGLVLSVVAIFIVFATQSAFSKAIDKATDSTTTSSSSSSSAKTSATKWSQADFDALQKGDLMNKAQGGDSLSSIEAKHGKPSSTSTASVNGMDAQTAIWSNTNGSLGANVSLSFIKQDDGSWLLYSSAATGLK